jgi:hypothetical protein
MKSKKLLSYMGDIDDKFVEETMMEPEVRRPRQAPFRIRRLVPAAACLIILIGVALFQNRLPFINPGNGFSIVAYAADATRIGSVGTSDAEGTLRLNSYAIKVVDGQLVDVPVNTIKLEFGGDNLASVAIIYPDGFRTALDCDAEHSKTMNIDYSGDVTRDYVIDVEATYKNGAAETKQITVAGISIPEFIYDDGGWSFYWTGFTSSKEGWFIGSVDPSAGMSESYIYLTHDGGETWQETNNVNGEWARVLTCGAFANAQTGFLCFRYDMENIGPIYRTIDGGKTWSRIDIAAILDLPANAPAVAEARSISFNSDTGNGTIVLYTRVNDTEENEITLKTTDFGRTWMKQ